MALDTSSRTSVALVRDPVRAALGHRAGVRAGGAGPRARCSRRPMPRWSSAIRRWSSIRRRPASTRSTSARRGATLTGLPFVYAAWAGRPGAARPAHLPAALRAATAAWRAIDAIAAAAARRPGAQARGRAYLRDNLGTRSASASGPARRPTSTGWPVSGSFRAPAAAHASAVDGPREPPARGYESDRMDRRSRRLVAKAEAGERLDADEALRLYRDAPTAVLGRLADAVRARKHPDGVVTYIIDRNVNYTNVCVARCNFCAFYRPVGARRRLRPRRSTRSSARSTRPSRVGGNQLLLQGGHNPDLPLAWYEDLFRAVKARYPDFKLHALSPPEVLHISRMSQLSMPRGARAPDRRRPRQHPRRRRRDPRRPRPQAAQLLQQGDRRRVAAASCARRTAPACARPRR